MSGLSVKQSADEFLRSIEEFRQRTARKAVAMALNRVADGVITDATREIRKRYNLKLATVRKAFSVQKATPQSLTVVVRVRGRPLNLGNFAARATKRGVTVNVKGGGRKQIPHAFILKVPTRDGEGTFGVVMIREDPKGHAKTKRLPIRPLTSVDVPGVFSTGEIMAIVRQAAAERFGTELPAAIKALKLQEG